MKLSGAELLVRSLEEQGVEIVFGYPGSCVMSVLDRLYDRNGIRHILVRHEQGAVHGACGYSQLARRTGVVLVTSGPGSTNTCTGIAEAFAGGIPLLVITGQVASNVIGTDAFQEVDIISLTASITKWNMQVRKAEEIGQAVAKAFEIASEGRQGPVLLDITKDALNGRAEYTPRVVRKGRYAELFRLFEESGKEVVVVTDRVSYNLYGEVYGGAERVLQSSVPNSAGFGLPAAIGARLALGSRSERRVCLVAGAFEFQSTIQELGVIRQEGLPIKMVILNEQLDERLGMVNPDFVQLAEAYGIKGEWIRTKEGLSEGVRRLLNEPESYLLAVEEGII